MVAGWPLVLVWRFYQVGGMGNYSGRLASCHCLEVYHVGGMSDYGGLLASCHCLEVLSRGRNERLWWPAGLLSLSGGSITWAE